MARKKVTAPAASAPVAATPTAPTTVRAAIYPDSAKIRVLRKDNPKRAGSAAYDLFTAYAKSPTVGDYVKNVATMARRPKAARAALAWDVKHGFISVE
jgi:hypothetical protein